jgi:hypothetical protein
MPTPEDTRDNIDRLADWAVGDQSNVEQFGVTGELKDRDFFVGEKKSAAN